MGRFLLDVALALFVTVIVSHQQARTVLLKQQTSTCEQLACLLSSDARCGRTRIGARSLARSNGRFSLGFGSVSPSPQYHSISPRSHEYFSCRTGASFIHLILHPNSRLDIRNAASSFFRAEGSSPHIESTTWISDTAEVRAQGTIYCSAYWY